MSDIINKAITDFVAQKVQSTDDGIKENNQIAQNLVKVAPVIKSTIIFNRANTSHSNLKPVINIQGKAGLLKELVIISTFTYNMGIVIDGVKYHTVNSAYESFTAIGDYSDTFTGTIDGADYIVSLKNINFADNLLITTDITSSQYVSNMALVYEIYELIAQPEIKCKGV